MNIDEIIFTKQDDINNEEYFIADYYVECNTNLYYAAREIAIGQSFGNPNVRSKFENETLIKNHSNKVILGEHSMTDLQKLKKGRLKIAFPLKNIDFDNDGISHLLCIILGGQIDIDNIVVCHVLDLTLPLKIEKKFKKPKFGISGIRKFTNNFKTPLLGGIIKPKTGMNLKDLEAITYQMVDGGVNFIKEDEILASPSFLPLKKRVQKIAKILENNKVVFCHCINSDPLHLEEKVKIISEYGGNGVHINIWSGLGSYKSIRDLDKNLFIHYQKSGDKILLHNKNPFRLDSKVLNYLAYLSGIDTIHVGMIGGYSNTEGEVVKQSVAFFQKNNIVPALSCGLNASNVNNITDVIGIDYLANSGGGIHGHPDGTKAGVIAIKNAMNQYSIK